MVIITFSFLLPQASTLTALTQAGRLPVHAEWCRPLPPKHGLGFAASLHGSGTAGRLLWCGSRGYAVAPPALRSSGVLCDGRWTVVIGLYAFVTWVGSTRAVDAHRPHHLAIYLQQPTLPSASPVVPRVCCLHRLGWFALRLGSLHGLWQCKFWW